MSSPRGQRTGHPSPPLHSLAPRPSPHVAPEPAPEQSKWVGARPQWAPLCIQRGQGARTWAAQRGQRQAQALGGPWPSPPGGCGKGRPHPPAFQTRCTGFPALGAQVRVQVWLRLAARRPQYPASAPPPLGAQRMAPHDSHVSPEHPPPSPNPGATAAGHATVPHHPGSWPGCTELQQRGLFILMAVYRPHWTPKGRVPSSHGPGGPGDHRSRTSLSAAHGSRVPRGLAEGLGRPGGPHVRPRLPPCSLASTGLMWRTRKPGSLLLVPKTGLVGGAGVPDT